MKKSLLAIVLLTSITLSKAENESNVPQVSQEVVAPVQEELSSEPTINQEVSAPGESNVPEVEKSDAFAAELDHAADVMHEAGITGEIKPLSFWKAWLQGIGGAVLIQYINLRYYLSKMWQSIVPGNVEKKDHVENCVK